jgi:hypothetical protein
MNSSGIRFPKDVNLSADCRFQQGNGNGSTFASFSVQLGPIGKPELVFDDPGGHAITNDLGVSLEGRKRTRVYVGLVCHNGALSGQGWGSGLRLARP